jgi:hypothetical protein
MNVSIAVGGFAVNSYAETAHADIKSSLLQSGRTLKCYDQLKDEKVHQNYGLPDWSLPKELSTCSTTKRLHKYRCQFGQYTHIAFNADLSLHHSHHRVYLLLHDPLNDIDGHVHCCICRFIFFS